MTANQAFLTGEVLCALRLAQLDALPVLKDAEYSNQIRVRRPSGWWRITVEPEERTEP